MAKSKDLFDDSTMSFGEHLEVLRTHLIRALLGLTIAVIFTLFKGNDVIAIIRGPLDDALKEYGHTPTASELEEAEKLQKFDFWEYVKSQFTGKRAPLPKDPALEAEEAALAAAAAKPPTGTEPAGTDPAATTEVSPQLAKAREERAVTVTIQAADLASAMHELDPERYPKVEQPDARTIRLPISAPEFSTFKMAAQKVDHPKPVTLNVQEAFSTYLKVSFVAGFVLASPWVFYQLWLFVAAGLYPHERKYIYVYLPLSVFLFIAGVVFCFKAALPFVLSFLLGFNAAMGVEPNIRLSEWISFALFLPLMFGISFQLPLVMLFLERISIFDVKAYREKRRMSILVIAIVSMLLTPPDPMSMLIMMCPLLLLYEFGILLCQWSPTVQSPFAGEPA